MDIGQRFARRALDKSQVAAWSALLDATETEDHQDEFLDTEELAGFIDNPEHDYEHGSLALYDGDAMTGFAALWPRTAAEPVHAMRLFGAVHPAWRGQGIGGYLVNWAERTAPVLHAERFAGHPLSLSASVQEGNKSAVELFTARGYQPTRWFLRMTCELTAEPAPALVPDGIRIVGFTAERSADARQIRDEAFRDHWDTTASTQEGWDHFLGFQAFRPQYSFLAYHGDEPLAVVIGHEYDSYTQATGRLDLYIPTVATRKAARGRGLATALLATALRAARADGFVSSTLDVDGDSPTGAGRIYERAGYQVVDRSMTMVKELLG